MKKFSQRFRFGLATVLLASSLAGCGIVSDGGAGAGAGSGSVNAPNNSGGAANGGAVDDGKIVIGMSMDTLNEERWQKDRDILTEKDQELGGEVKVLSA
ncbi:hypothetical protein P9747_19960, partial [Paenibacillus macerans]|nr:hypothetical protein [Paenibacillus macerans]